MSSDEPDLGGAEAEAEAEGGAAGAQDAPGDAPGAGGNAAAPAGETASPAGEAVSPALNRTLDKVNPPRAPAKNALTPFQAPPWGSTVGGRVWGTVGGGGFSGAAALSARRLSLACTVRPAPAPRARGGGGA